MQNEQAQELMKWLLETLQQAKAFVLEQAPALAREIIAFGRIYETAQFALAAAILGVGLWYLVFRLASTIKLLDSEEDEILAGVRLLIQGVACPVVGLIATSVTTRGVVLVWFAPRLYLLEYLSSALGG